MENFSNESYPKMDERHAELTDLLQTLFNVVKEVRVVVNQTPYSIVSLEQDGSSEERTVKASSITPPIRNQVLGQATDLGTPKLNTMVKISIMSPWIFVHYRCLNCIRFNMIHWEEERIESVRW